MACGRRTNGGSGISTQRLAGRCGCRSGRHGAGPLRSVWPQNDIKLDNKIKEQNYLILRGRIENYYAVCTLFIFIIDLYLKTQYLPMEKHLLIALTFFFSAQLCFAQNINYSMIDQTLIDKLESTNDDWFDIYINMEDKVDIKALDQDLTQQRASQSQRAKVIMHALTDKAKSSQSSILEMLEKDTRVQKGSIKSYWLANVIFLRANRSMIASLSHDVRIEFMGVNGLLELEEVVSESAAVMQPDDAEIGLDRINVRPLWDMGYTGYGQLALVADTGIDPTHSSYSSRYRGVTNAESEAWFAFGQQPRSPFQCGDHGTHVLGTVLGLDRATRDTIGVAFDAQWLGSANLCGGGTNSNIETFQWALNPDNDIDTTEDMADVINNSWRDSSVANSQCNGIYVDILEALEALGVVVVFSAGNSGPDPETITPPKNISLNLVNVFSIAALDGSTPSLPIAGFSSRGPSICEGEGSLAIKPEVSAPGVNVRSAGLNNQYGLKSGTSMAAPHVSGAVLILRQAFPEASARELKLALYFSARDIGEPGEDNMFGMGIIDVFAAYNYLIAEGFEPAPPASFQYDVVANDIITSIYECDNTLSAKVALYNNSPNIISSLDIRLSVLGANEEEMTTNWIGTIAPFTLDTISLDDFDLPAGKYTVNIELTNPNGEVDERFLNNILNKEVTVSSFPGLEVLSVEDQVACEGANILVKSNFTGTGEVRWYDQLTDGNIIAEGVQAVVEANEARTIYGGVLKIENTGKIKSDSEEINLSSATGLGIRFDVETPLRITAVDFYSEESGNLIAIVDYTERDNDGDLQEVKLYNNIISSDGSGWQTKEVDWLFLPRSDYSLYYQTGNVELGTVASNLEYPYTIDDVISVTNSVGTNSYPYFFNLQVEYEDLCGRFELELEAVETDSLPLASFVSDTTEVNLSSNQSITFSNTSTNGASYLWDFGDGTTSEEENTMHTYTEAGTYYVSLMATNDDGCSDTFIQTIEVFNTTSIFDPVEVNNSFVVSPNPFDQTINFSSDTPIQVEDIALYSSAGVLVQTFSVDAKIANHSQEIADLVPGLYYVLIQTATGVDIHKMVKY